MKTLEEIYALANSIKMDAIERSAFIKGYINCQQDNELIYYQLRKTIYDMKRQSNWFKTDKDISFENSFKFWFALMWQNHYIHLFLLGFVLVVLELVNFQYILEVTVDNFNDTPAGGTLTVIGALIPITIVLIIVYKGFYQFFNDLKNGISR